MRININERNIYLIPAIAFIIALISAFSISAFLIIVFFLISIFLYLFSIRSRAKILLRLISIAIVLHLILFPLTYLLLLINNPKAIDVNNTILQNEETEALAELYQEYDSIDIAKKKLIIPQILKTQNFDLSNPISTLKVNIVAIDSFLCHNTQTFRKGISPNAGFSTLSICNSKGIHLISIIGDHGGKISSDLSWKEFLYKELEKINTKSFEFEQNEKEIKAKKVWNYANLLPYSINILDSDNFIPISKLSNVIYFIHRFVVFSLIIGLIGTAYWDFFTKKQ